MMWLVAVGALVIGVRWSIVLAVIAYVIGYVASCWWIPRVDCFCCHGSGKHRSEKNPRKWRRCLWCRGRGSFRRLGRWSWDTLTGSVDRSGPPWFGPSGPASQ